MRHRERTVAFLSKKNGKWELIKSDLSVSFMLKTSSAARHLAKSLRWSVWRQKDWDT